MTFCGERSRWTMPSGFPVESVRSCTWPSASATLTPMATTSDQSIDARVRRARAHFAEAAPLDVFDDDVRFAGSVGRRLENPGPRRGAAAGLARGLRRRTAPRTSVGRVVAADDLDHAGALGSLDARGGGQVNFTHPTPRQAPQKPESTKRPGNTLFLSRVPHDGRFGGHAGMVPGWCKWAK